MGAFRMMSLAEKLLNEFGRGFSGDTLKNARKFYLIYKDRISGTVFSLLNEDVPFQLSWSLKCQNTTTAI